MKERLPAALRDQADPLSYFPNWYQTALAAGDPLALELQKSLSKWAAENGLHFGWMTEVVIHTLSRWSANPNFESPCRWVLPHPSDWHPMEYAERVIFYSTDWDPFTTPRKTAKNEIMADFKAQLEEQLNRIEVLSKERGIPELPEKRKLDQHLRWLIWSQVKGESFSDIARRTGKKDPEQQGRKSVAEGVRTTADLIGLVPLRDTDLGGRPRISE